MILWFQDEISTILFYALAEEGRLFDRVVEHILIHNYRKYVQEYLRAWKKFDEDNSIIFEKVDNLYSYYTGLVASKINDKYNKPCILYRKPKDGKIIGSIRSPYPIKQQLKDSGVFDWAEGKIIALTHFFPLTNGGQLLIG